MRRFSTIIFAYFMLVGCSAAHSNQVRNEISEKYGNNVSKRQVVVKKKSGVIQNSQTTVGEPDFKKSKTPLKKIAETETLIASSASDVSKNSVEDYISLYSEVAMQSMKMYGIPASIKLAQGILESGSGNGTLCRTANNHFGIKCKEEWAGETVLRTDDAPNECFRKYNSALDSYNDHSKFLANRSFYQHLFTLDISDYKAWARGLKKAGYATDPRYAQKLINIIERYRLFEFDRQVLDSGYTTPLRTTVATNFSNATTYIVQSGDTLYTISRKFNATVDEIKRLNNLSGSTISVGQRLIVQ